MTFTLALAQTKHPVNGDVISLVKRNCAIAKESKADIIVFPESLMTRFEKTREAFVEDAQSLDGPFSSAIDLIAKESALWIVYTMNEKNPASELPYNTAVVVDDKGVKQGVYRKVHLFDSSKVTESSRMSASDAIFSPIDTPFGRLGLGICYDLRFCEYARKQACDGCCDILVYPAAWVDGPAKELQWKRLLQARAIENQIFVAGVSRCDEGYIGSSCVYGPSGEPVLEAGRSEGVFFAEIDLEEIKSVRQAIPALEHRRTDLY